MLKHICLITSLWLVTGLGLAHETHVTPLLDKRLVGFDASKLTGQMLIVEYGPGGETPKHRHPAHTFIYVLQGTVEMQVEGKPPVRLSEGDSFYEHPQDIHLISRNASATEKATFLVFSVKEWDTELVIPVE